MTAPALRHALSAAVLLLAAAPLRADTLKVPSDDFATIQSAIDAAAAGDVVQVSKGIYAENLVIATAGITLKGKGATINGRYLGSCIVVEADDVRVESLTLANGGLPPGADGAASGGLLATGDGLVLSKLIVRACDEFGILLAGTGTIQQCQVDACAGDGIIANTVDPTGPTLTVLSKNKVTRCDGGMLLDDGPFTVQKNTCEQNEGVGLQVSIPVPIGDGEAVSGSTVTKNTLRDNGGAGLHISQLAPVELGVNVDKNTIEDNGLGASFEGFFIFAVGNTIQDNRGDGLVVSASSCEVTGNKIRGNGVRGLVLAAADAADDGGPPQGLNTVQENTLQDNGSDGLQVLSSANLILDNTAKDNLGDGIDVGLTADDNVLDGNKAMGNEHDGIDNTGVGTVLIDNQCKNNGGADIAGAGDGTGTVDAKLSSGNTVGDDSDITTYATPGELEKQP
jgi:parallel beta-helix repeat protein